MMLKSMLVLLNDARRAYHAFDLAIRWAGTHEAQLVGMSVLDVDEICGAEPVPLGGMSAKQHRDQVLLEEARSKLAASVDRFQSLCVQANVVSQGQSEEGRVSDVIARESQRHDLVLVDQPHIDRAIGSLTFDQLVTVVKHSPRPLVAVPDRASTSNDVVIAYDGSIPAARTVQAFVQSGLAKGRDVRVVGVAEGYVTAVRRVDRAVDYLKLHGITAKSVPIMSDDDPAAVILDHLSLYPTGLLVMGSFGENAVREFFLGSVTRRLLSHATVPVFLGH